MLMYRLPVIVIAMNSLDKVISACLQDALLDQPERKCCPTLKHNFEHIICDIASIKSLPGFHTASDMQTALKHASGMVMVMGSICIERSEGLRDRYLVPVQKASEYYNLGATLELDFAERFFPPLKRVIQYLANALALPKAALGKAILYFSPGGGGLPAHFDAYYNFVFQMVGTKTWSLLDNKQATRPTVHYELHEYPHMPAQLKSYWQGIAPKNYLAISQNEVLAPGSVLYLPRGVWHQTEAETPSVSLNITYSIPTVLDVALAHIKQDLVQYEIMRENADTILPREAHTYLQQFFARLDHYLGEKWHQYPTEEINLYQAANKAFHSITEFMHI
jgi:50S ribosomal protein L16 3-hydroxylase